MIKKIDIHLHPQPADPGLDKYLKLMDKYNVTHGLVHGLMDTGWDDMGFKDYEANNEVARIVKAHKDRFFGTVCVNFNDGVQKVKDQIKKFGDLGLSGIKVFPNLGFDPNDEQWEPIWQEAEKRKMIVFSHCGWLLPNSKNPQMRIGSLLGASPFHFEVPARRHKDLTFIFAHFGGGATYLETIVLCSRLPNVFGDTCPGWGRWVFENNLSGMSAMPKDHILYGTDNAADNYGMDDVWWTNKLTSLGWNYDDLYRYFWLNNAKILKLVP